LIVALGTSLLARLHRLIERSYDWNTGIEDVGPFVLGDAQYRRLFQEKEFFEELPESDPGPRTLMTWQGPWIRLSIYYPDALIAGLEKKNPLRRLDEENVGPLSVLVEELDHLLMLAWCARHRRRVGLMELEFHANITKFMVVAHLVSRLSRRPRLTRRQRLWVMHHLFHGAGDGLPAPFCQRYHTAARLAVRFIAHLESMPGSDRLRALRRVARKPWELQRACLESPEPQGRLGLLLGI
jgi:hypothetical protein